MIVDQLLHLCCQGRLLLGQWQPTTFPQSLPQVSSWFPKSTLGLSSSDNRAGGNATHHFKRSPWLAQPVVHRASSLHDSVGTLPGGKELASFVCNQVEDLVSRLEYTGLRRPVIQDCWAHWDSSRCSFTHYIVDSLSHAAHMLVDGAMERELLFPVVLE